MSTSNPRGGQKFAFNGLPFSGVQNTAATGNQKYAFNGLPASALYPPSLAVFAISGAAAVTPRWANPSAWAISGHAAVAGWGTLPAHFAIAGTAVADFIGQQAPHEPVYSVLGLTPGVIAVDASASSVTISPIGKPLAPAVAGTLDLPALPTPPGLTGAIVPTPFDHFYNRIWVLPAELMPINPRLATNIPFAIFNAFEAVNVLGSIGVSGGTGLTLDLSAPSSFGALEMRDVNLQIGPTAPPKVDATFTFTFGSGAGSLHFKATVTDFVVMFPDEGATETWTWQTQIFTNQNGSEQRTALRTAPRRAVEMAFLLDQTERRNQYRRWHRSIGGRLVVPYYWYAARITAAANAGATRIYFDPAQTDVRAGDNLVIADPLTYAGQLVVASTIETDGATLAGPLAADVTTGMIVAPGFNSRLIDQTGLVMTQVTGKATVKAETMAPRAPFARPDAAPVIATHDGYDVLDRQPVARGDVDEAFTVSYELFDGGSGVVALDQAWTHPFVSGTRTFRIERERSLEMDYWRNFLDARRGMLAPFLMRTWHPDLTLASAPDGTNVLVLPADDSDYAAELFPFATYKRLAIVSAAGTAYVTVDTATLNLDGTTTLHLTAPYGATADERNVSMVSYLNLCRLGDDSVKLTHDAVRTTLELKFRTVDA